MTERKRLISWVESDVLEAGPLGANINHDEKSKNFPFAPARAVQLKTKSHRNYGPPLNQSPIGACTGFTGANYLNTKPHRPVGRRLFDNQDGFTFYSEATKIDPWHGTWLYPPPPGSGEDTGSDALSVCKVLKRIGLIGSYHWTFGLQHTLEALMESPVMLGIEWYEGFDRPDKTGRVKISGAMRGRHEILLVGLDTKLRLVKGLNQWGNWGLRREGYFTFHWDDLGYLLNREGDAVVAKSPL